MFKYVSLVQRDGVRFQTNEKRDSSLLNLRRERFHGGQYAYFRPLGLFLKSDGESGTVFPQDAARSLHMVITVGKGNANGYPIIVTESTDLLGSNERAPDTDICDFALK